MVRVTAVRLVATVLATLLILAMVAPVYADGYHSFGEFVGG